jgi:hypothetical protein
MSDPSLALQGALVTALKAAAPVTALVAQRIYDRPPGPAPTFPYVTLGLDQVIADHAECLEGSVEINTQIDVWSRAAGKVEAKQITGVIVSALNMANLALTGYRLVLLEHESSRHFDDPDGLTTHSALTFKALIDET